jgi:hypothetical protein
MLGATSDQGSAMDPFSHPDLARLGRDLRSRLDDTLDAEQEAARSAAQRRMSFRDRLILSADRSELVLLSTADGHLYRGIVTAVGLDHVVVEDGGSARYVSTNHIVTMEPR